MAEIALGTFLIELALAYLFWRLLRQVYTSPYRAFDLIFFSLLITLVFARAFGLIAAYGSLVPFQNWWEIFKVWDLKLMYQLIVFTPLIAFQFISVNVEKKQNWFRYSGLLIIFGLGFVIPLFFTQIIRSSYSTDSAAQVYYILQAAASVISLALLVYTYLKVKNFKMYPWILFFYTLASIVITLFSAVPSQQMKNTYTVALCVMFILAVLPFSGIRIEDEDKNSARY